MSPRWISSGMGPLVSAGWTCLYRFALVWGQARISRPMLESVTATPVYPHPFRKGVIDAMLSLHEDPRGRQLLMVFKTERLLRSEPADLDSSRELWRDYYGLAGSLPHRPPFPALAAENSQVERAKERL